MTREADQPVGAGGQGAAAEPWWTVPGRGMVGLSFEDLVLRATVADENEAGPAVNELGRAGGPRVVDLGIRWLSDVSPVTRSRGAALLSAFGEAALAAGRIVPSELGDALVLAAAAEADPDPASSMVIALCRCRAEQGLPWLLSLPPAARPEVMRSLVVCLPEFGGRAPGVVDCMERLLDHPDEEMRDWASYAFAHPLASSDTTTLGARLLELAGSDEAPVIRYQAILALAVRGDRRVLPYLAAALLTPITRDEADLVDFGDLTAAASRLPDESLVPGLRSWIAGTSGPGKVWASNPLWLSERDPRDRRSHRPVDPAGVVPIRRVWLRVDSLDHPHALGNYQRRGFRIYRTERDRR